MLIDSHAHLYLDAFDSDLDGVVSRSRAAGVERIYMPNIDSISVQRMLDLETRYPGFCRPMMGLHPCSVKDDFETELELAERWHDRRQFAAVGEIGIDLYWDKTFFEQQKEAFSRQVRLALGRRLPVVIHCRNSLSLTIDLLADLWRPGLSGVFHCFSGTADEARKIAEMGFYIGIGGVVTYKNSGLEYTLKETGIDRVLLETDSPYLSPVPHRGRRNEPANLVLISERIASITGLSPDAVAETTTHNSLTLFGDAR